MKFDLLSAFSMLLCLIAACADHPRARSERSFDEIASRARSLRSEEVALLLGEPDTHQAVSGNREKWIWWNYTYLAGSNYPPEIRGQVVHLEIFFRKSRTVDAGTHSDSGWPVAEPYGIRYRAPGAASQLTGTAP